MAVVAGGASTASLAQAGSRAGAIDFAGGPARKNAAWVRIARRLSPDHSRNENDQFSSAGILSQPPSF
ncbi:hypothetical protein DF153_14215 [Burkholderia cenocepacia]|nr:hypothetical protein DF152_18580 [Burkholderia cenocepacia]RQU24685.1 hypothetical protein DF153_14215 [Burkholderia cenocepacia]